MSDVGQAIGTVVGGVIGFFVGGPAGAVRGAALGYSITAPKAEGESPTYSFGTQYNTASQTIPVPVVYGRNLVAGNTIYKKVTGDNNEKMAIQVAVSEGPIQSITSIKANDVDITSKCRVKLGERTQAADTINDQGQTFPYTAYISVELTANENLSGNPTITSIVEGRKVEVWDGSQWVVQYSQNPAYCLLDFLTNKRYGLGISKEDIDLDSFITVAEYCDELVDGEPRFQLDYVVDYQKSSLDHIQDILATFRGFLIYSAGEFRLNVDGPEEPVQSFTMDNIVADSFSYWKTSRKERYNRVVIEYTDPDNHWEKIGAQYSLDNDIQKRGLVEETIPLLGINRFSQAGRMAKFFQKKSWYCPTFCQFKVGIDSLHCEAGDVVKVSHDVPGWNEKPFMILEVREEENDEMLLTCQEYNVAVYSDDGVVQQVKKDSDLPNPFEPPDEVENLQVSEYGYLNADGTHIANINYSFDIPDDNRYDGAVISVSKNGGEFHNYGTINTNEGQISNVQTGADYQIKVQTKSKHLGILSSGVTSKVLTITGKDNKPPDVAELIVAQDDENVIFHWEQVSGPDIIGYEIREGIDWDSGRLIGTKIPGETYKYNKETDGTKRYMIKALDRGGNYSENPGVAIFTVEGSGNKLNIIQEKDELAEGTGNYDALTNYNNKIVFAHNLSFADYPGLSFASAEASLTFNSMPKIDTTGEYISDVIDTNKIGRTNIRLKIGTSATDPGGSMSSMPGKSFAEFAKYSFANPPAIYNIKIYIRFSDDNSIWSNWQKFVPGQYRFRYCQFKITVESESKTAEIEINEFVEIYDVPDVVLEIENFAVSSSGETIIFADYGKEFYEKPKLFSADIVNDNGLKFPVFTNKTKYSVDIELYDVNNNRVSGTAEEVRIQGY